MRDMIFATTSCFFGEGIARLAKDDGFQTILEISSIANSTSETVSLLSCSAREDILTPQFVTKAPPMYGWATKEQIVLLHFT
jgi:hypothetical protein